MGKIITPEQAVLPTPAGSVVTDPFTLGLKNLNTTQSPSGLQMYAEGFKDPKAVENLGYIIKDVLSGDPSAARREEYAYLNFNQLKIAIEWLLNNNLGPDLQQLLLEKPYLLTFKDKPPTPEEFLTSKYIGTMAESVWYPVRKNFLAYFDPLSPHRNGILNPAIGSGKPQPLTSKVYTDETHYKLMGDIEVGDEVLTPFGKSTVVQIHPQPKQKVYKITLEDGRTVRCGETHLWTVSWEVDGRGKKIWKTVTTKFMIDHPELDFDIPTYEERFELQDITLEACREMERFQ